MTSWRGLCVRLQVVSSDIPRAQHVSARAPLTAWDWVLLNLKVGTLTFGTGSVAPIYRRMLVDSCALTADQFQEALTLAQLLPGANLVSLAMRLGTVLFGAAWAMLGVVALCVPGAVGSILALRFMPVGSRGVQAWLAGCAVGAAVMVLDLTWQLRPGLSASHVSGETASGAKKLGRLGVAFAVAAGAFNHVPLGTVALVGGVSGLLIEFCS